MLWLLTVVAGLGVMLAYEETPGVAAIASPQWPDESRVRLASDRPTLIMLAHPHCPCTRASIGELNTLMARCQGKIAVTVLFLKPKAFPAGWEKTDLWRSAATIPGVKVLCDDGGIEARKFHAMTSGQTMLFDSAGQLLFSGGITGGRGHAGDNVGRDAIISLVTTGKSERSKSFVFGCALRNSTS